MPKRVLHCSSNIEQLSSTFPWIETLLLPLATMSLQNCEKRDSFIMRCSAFRQQAEHGQHQDAGKLISLALQTIL